MVCLFLIDLRLSGEMKIIDTKFIKAYYTDSGFKDNFTLNRGMLSLRDYNKLFYNLKQYIL